MGACPPMLLGKTKVPKKNVKPFSRSEFSVQTGHHAVGTAESKSNAKKY